MGIDFKKLEQEAIRISTDPAVDWQVEKITIGAHELQAAAPEGRTSFIPPEFLEETGEEATS